MDTEPLCFLYSTFPDAASAQACARAAIGQGLAACVNVYPPMQSFYIWKGKIVEETETAVFFKTRRSLVDRLISAIRPLHPYSVPCFLILPIEGGNDDYLAWARERTRRMHII